VIGKSDTVRDNKLILLVGAVSLIMFVGLLLPAVFTNLSEDSKAGVGTGEYLGEYTLNTTETQEIEDTNITITDIQPTHINGSFNSEYEDEENFTVDTQQQEYLNHTALSFDGEDDYVEVPDDDNLDVSGDFSISVWFRTDDATGHQHFFEYPEDWDSGTYQLVIEGGDLRFNFYEMNDNEGPLDANPTMGDGDWHHAVGVMDDTNDMAYLYFDDSLANSQSVTSSKSSAIGTGYIACREGTTHFFGGGIAEVRVYDRALSDSEISDLYNSTDITDGLVSHWDFSEGTGDTLYDRYGSNDGTIYGANWTEEYDYKFYQDIEDSRTYEYNISTDAGYTLEFTFLNSSHTEDYVTFEVTKYYMHEGMIDMYNLYPIILLLLVVSALLVIVGKVIS